MTVTEAIEKLKEMQPDAELHFCTRHDLFGFPTAEAEEMYASTTRVGILTDNPRTVEIVVLDTSTCGL